MYISSAGSRSRLLIAIRGIDIKFSKLFLNKRYQQIQKILRYACSIVLFTIGRYFTCFEAVNFQ